METLDNGSLEKTAEKKMKPWRPIATMLAEIVHHRTPLGLAAFAVVSSLGFFFAGFTSARLAMTAGSTVEIISAAPVIKAVVIVSVIFGAVGWWRLIVRIQKTVATPNDNKISYGHRD